VAALKNQHFVPKCLLKPFSHQDEGRAINLYNIRHDKLIPRAPVKGQCARDYLYGKDGVIEQSLSKIEGSFSTIRNCVLAGGNESQDMRDLNFFTYLQFRRTEMAVSRIRESYELMTAGIFGASDAPAIPNDHMLIMDSLRYCFASVRYIEDLKIRMIENKSDIDFVISDDPAIFANRYAAQKLKDDTFGISSSGVFLTMPLSPKLAVICYDGLVYTIPDLVDGRIVVVKVDAIEALNEFQNLKAGENVYFQDWEKRDYVREEFLAVKARRPTAWSAVTHLVPVAGKNETYVEGTVEEAKRAGKSLLKMSFKYPQPSRWFPPLKFRGKPKTFFEETGAGHVRKAEWLRGG
jgi:hypothetical protein